MLFEAVSGDLRDPTGLDQTLDKYRRLADEALERSSLLVGLDMESGADQEEALRRIGDDRHQRPEWWALLLVLTVDLAREALAEGDAQRAGWNTLWAANAWSMLVFLRQLEPLVWHGYQTYGAGVLRRVLEIWEKNQDNPSEEFWQSLFDQYPFIVSQVLAYPIVVVEDKAYVGGKTIADVGGHIVDFLLAHQLTRNVALLELKTPTTKLLRWTPYRGGVYGPSGDLTGATSQVATQRDSLLRSPELLAAHPEELAAFNSQGIVIIGRTTELDDESRRRSFELYRSHLAGITIITFDELFENIRGLLATVEGS
jgi:Domain of unknown function (DUF4263)